MMTDEEKSLNTKLWYWYLTGRGWHEKTGVGKRYKSLCKTLKKWGVKEC